MLFSILFAKSPTMTISRSICLLLCLSLALALLATGVNAQEGTSSGNRSNESQSNEPADNLFHQWRAAAEQQAQQRRLGNSANRETESSGDGAMISGGSEMGMMPTMGMPGMDRGAGMGMGGMGMGMEMGLEEPPPSPSELFQQAIRQSVQQLRAAKTETEKKKLLELVQEALHERYERALAQREQELDELEQRLQELRTDLERRRGAQEKVVEVQLRTVELAGEGLVEADASR